MPKLRYAGYACRLAAAKMRLGRRLQLDRFSISLNRGVRMKIEPRARIRLGHRCCLFPGIWLEADEAARLTIGPRVFVNHGCSLVARYGIEIGEGCLLGEYVSIYDHNHMVTTGGALRRDLGFCGAPVRIGRNVWLGGKVFVGAGVTIGDNTVVGANTVITRDLPPNSIVHGRVELVIRPLEPGPVQPAGVS